MPSDNPLTAKETIEMLRALLSLIDRLDQNVDVLTRAVVCRQTLTPAAVERLRANRVHRQAALAPVRRTVDLYEALTIRPVGRA